MDYLKRHSGNCVKGVKKNTKVLSPNTKWRGQNSKQTPHEYVRNISVLASLNWYSCGKKSVTDGDIWNDSEMGNTANWAGEDKWNYG